MLIGVILALVGAYCTVCWFVENLRTPAQLVLNGLRQLFDGKSFTDKYGEWAVITGASDGIGKGYAHYLAGKQMQLVLVARDEAKLNRVSNELTKKYGVRTMVLVADFTHGEEVYERLERELLPLDVGVLVNNVGLGYERGMCVEELPKRTLRMLLKVNIEPATLLCHALVPGMKARGRGLIINVSSLSAAAPAPFLTVYAAAKAYVRNFSAALREELRPHRVEVQTVLPGFVRTNMTQVVATEFKDGPIAKQLVSLNNFMRYAGFTIGKTDRTCGHWSHGLQCAGLSLVPERVRIFVLKVIYSHLRKATAV
ncbi:inactive hydroxysteroid dehydrogenase-like protein 1 [Anopheles ziemanni]|uniref:inactive hydroxysteroid dehydrogenase-like protein 1 n=1 Tax=Anopheles coustani TaxID=139045 RepID=UPI002658075D|nr:inactive hydroxysteroid dehydrogenase-like protein 1 [Anopheles coustani]XP_058168457.1 inactive hydroxysteroid dehydrogenase-like protein 1 [Anopheles ziemanni]